MEKLKSFFTPLFTDFYSEESLSILFFLTISFLIGLLFGALSRGGKIRRLKKMVKERDDELITLRAENGAFKEKLETSEEKLQEALLNYETTNSLLGEMEVERNRIHSELEKTKLIVNTTSNQDGDSSQKIDELNETILDLQLRNDKLEEQLEASHTDGIPDTFQPVVTDEGDLSRFDLLENKLEKLESENISLRSTLIDIKGQTGAFTDDSLNTIKSRLEQLEVENDRLQKDLSGLKGSNSALDIDMGGGMEDKQAKARTALNAAIGTRIKRVDSSAKNNLKLIEGIGPFIETKLNDIGIYTFEQIAQLDNELIDYVTDAIQFFQGRIQRDNWVGQAKKLMN